MPVIPVAIQVRHIPVLLRLCCGHPTPRLLQMLHDLLRRPELVLGLEDFALLLREKYERAQRPLRWHLFDVDTDTEVAHLESRIAQPLFYFSVYQHEFVIGPLANRIIDLVVLRPLCRVNHG